ncbi:hypothetical protein LRR81_08650 [Metabacillus sp. GX 13764]|uniref:hypothetical protein n=1 Tax=Metabacillus kandeliae TaxID=2900151 RepID=UPI001E4CEC20|nr:hypothetical protein [Metabacillus kandeliae]MCD7034302.1 hypothetical protein [Metabacillus kandeliae]
MNTIGVTDPSEQGEFRQWLDSKQLASPAVKVSGVDVANRLYGEDVSRKIEARKQDEAAAAAQKKAQGEAKKKEAGMKQRQWYEDITTPLNQWWKGVQYQFDGDPNTNMFTAANENLNIVNNTKRDPVMQEIGRQVSRGANGATLGAIAEIKRNVDKRHPSLVQKEDAFSHRDLGKGGGLDFATDMASYLLPGEGILAGARLAGLGANLGTSGIARLAQFAKEGAATGAGFGVASAAIKKGINPDEHSYGDLAKEIAIDTALGGALNTGLGKLGDKLANSKKNQFMNEVFNRLNAGKKDLNEIVQSDSFTPKYEAIQNSIAKARPNTEFNGFEDTLKKMQAVKGETLGVPYPSREDAFRSFTMDPKELPKITVPKLPKSNDPALEKQVENLFLRDMQASKAVKEAERQKSFEAMFSGFQKPAEAPPAPPKQMFANQPQQELDFDRLYEGFAKYVKQQGYDENQLTKEALDEIFTHYAPKDFPYSLDQVVERIYKDNPAVKTTMHEQPIGPAQAPVQYTKPIGPEPNLKSMLHNDPKVNKALESLMPAPKKPDFSHIHNQMDETLKFMNEKPAPKNPLTDFIKSRSQKEAFEPITAGEEYVPLKRVDNPDKPSGPKPMNSEAPLSEQLDHLRATLKSTKDPAAKATIKEDIAKVEGQIKVQKEKSLIGHDATYEDLLQNSDNWKDKAPIMYQRETMERNFEDIMGKDAGVMKKVFIDPVKSSEAKRIRFLNTERNRIRDLKIKPGSKEDKLVQMYGEKKITLDELKDKTPQWEKVSQAAEHYRNMYDSLIKQANKVLKENGMKEIDYRKDYFPHYEDLSKFEKFFKEIGFDINNNSLPTDINGLTDRFRPNKNFFGNALRRKSDETAFGASEGADSYLEGISNIIHHTPNIKRLRGLEDSIRSKYEGGEKLNNFVVELLDYTNTLAGKKNMVDRAAERLVGRKVYNFVDTIRRRTAANMIGANVGSALTGYIPLTQSLATTSKKAFVEGMLQTMKNTFKNDGFIQKSDFLTKRIGADPLYRTAWDNTVDKSMWLMKTVDMFSAQTIVRSKYLEGISKGLNESQAMKQADDWASRIMAGRAKGDVPTLIGSKSLGALTQFQLEVNNQLSFIFKDIPRSTDKKGMASALAQLAIYSYGFNELYEKATGRRPAFDPIGIAMKAYNDYNNEEITNLKATENLKDQVLQTLPFTSAINGGRFPIGAGIPDVNGLLSGKANTTDEFLVKPASFIVTPAGGSQLKKMFEGLQAVGKNPIAPQDTPGVYNKNGTMKFPIKDDAANTARAAIFGKYAFPEYKDYFDKDRRDLSAKQTSKVEQSDNPLAAYMEILAERKAKKEKARQKGGE